MSNEMETISTIEASAGMELDERASFCFGSAVTSAATQSRLSSTLSIRETPKQAENAVKSME